MSSVIYLDTFGNVKLSALVGHLFGAMGQLGMGEPVYVRVTDAQGTPTWSSNWVDTFGNVPPGQALLYEDSYGRLTIAVNQGSAADLLSLREDAEVVITRAPLATDHGEQQWFDAAAMDPALMGPAGYDPMRRRPQLRAVAGHAGLAGQRPGQAPDGSEPVWTPPPVPEPDPTTRVSRSLAPRSPHGPLIGRSRPTAGSVDVSRPMTEASTASASDDRHEGEAFPCGGDPVATRALGGVAGSIGGKDHACPVIGVHRERGDAHGARDAARAHGSSAPRPADGPSRPGSPPRGRRCLRCPAG